MKQTYLDTAKWPEELFLIEGNFKTQDEIDKNKNEIEKSLKIKLKPKLEKLFNEIYDNFNINTPRSNEPITKRLEKSSWSGTPNIYDNYIEFCLYLLNRIENNESISKIQWIISNISSYKPSSAEYFKRQNVIAKRNSVMNAFNKKMWDKKNHLKKSNWQRVHSII